jgi:glycosyltransferase involved in cell wall biosynthesis
LKIVITVEEFDFDKAYLEYHLAKELIRLGHSIYVFTFNCRNKLQRSALSSHGLEVVCIPHFVSIHGYHIPSFAGIAYVHKFVKNKRPDIIHCMPLDSPLSLIFIMWKKLFNYKIVGSILTQLNMVFSPWGIKQKILFAISKITVALCVAKESSIVFAKTVELARLLSRSYGVPQDKFRIVSLGSDPSLYEFDFDERIRIRKKLGISESDVVLVYSGKLNYTKGLDVLIRALAPIVVKNNRAKLLIIGKGDVSFVQYLKRLVASLRLKQNVIFHPWIHKNSIPSFYSASDIGVWPGLSSVSIVDAASTGLPLVIARYPVDTFAIENGNGFAFEIGNVEELGTFLKVLIYDSGLRKEMGQKSRLLVEEKLNWRAITQRYIDIYTNVLKL